ncbi:hypothetical protein FRC20_006783, partial [Serendipita sp. 405]
MSSNNTPEGGRTPRGRPGSAVPGLHISLSTDSGSIQPIDEPIVIDSAPLTTGAIDMRDSAEYFPETHGQPKATLRHRSMSNPEEMFL